jgi:hypothetical protein
MAGPARSSTNFCRGLGLSRPEFASQLDRRSHSDQALIRVVVWSRHRLRYDWNHLRYPSDCVSNLNKKIYAKIATWRNRRIEGELGTFISIGIVMKRTWASEVRRMEDITEALWGTRASPSTVNVGKP